MARRKLSLNDPAVWVIMIILVIMFAVFGYDFSCVIR